MDLIDIVLAGKLAGGGSGGSDGVGIVKIEKTGSQGLVDTYTITLTNGVTYMFTVTNGKNGYSPVITENENNDADNYRLDITTENGTFTTPNLKSDGYEGKIDSIDDDTILSLFD